MNEFKVEVSCFKSWKEWISICELIAPNLGNLPVFKAAFYKEKLPISYYYTFLLENMLNTREKLEKVLLYLEQILSRDSKFNQISALATKQFLSHYLSLKYEQNEGNEKILIDIIRTISQFSDIYQESHKMNKSISQVLESINMKEGLFISEIRHMATHKELPSRILIQKSVEYMLEFLLENYWAKIYRKVKNQKLFLRNFEGFKEGIKALVREFEKKEDFDDILRDFQRNLKKNRFKCAIFLSEILRSFIQEGLEGTKEKTVVLQEIILEIFESKEKKIIGKFLKFPFVRYKLLRIVSLKTFNSCFGEVTVTFFAKFYAKNDKNMTFMKKIEEEIFNEKKRDEKAFSSEEIEAYLNENKEKLPSIL